ncbi:sigma-54 interaction domain-containing protein [Alicyclobacillus fastidiosus]|uniref:Sigma 54-interacting transcriptional regulator n=1 Tax=Alicyclobacillus fastidiosus TaxID=392011 RepID=A0ABV5AJU4_9BACL|nr:sigma 54-interacting transcriptional regulator [Alicyclobacillus fastidiosus]WEH09046.1 sigma 54-interacting transcriptional regulator [Alicyclobacillus fastidiosus]
MHKPTILLITKSRYVHRMFREQITDYFGDSVDLVDATTVGVSCNADLFLASYREVVKEWEFPPDKLLVARRTVDLSKIGDLIALPAGTKCLVVNNSLDTARETISCLENLGLNLELSPYDPTVNKVPHDVEVAVVAETGRDLVPEGMKRIVYIGMRPIDYATILDIGFRLQIPIPEPQVYSSKYIRQIVQLSGQLSGALENEKDLNRQMDAIFHTVHDGLIGIDKKGIIIQANQAAHRILGHNPLVTPLIGGRVQEVFPGVSVNDISSQETIQQMDDRYLVMNRTYMDEGRLGSVLAFQDVTRLQKLEQDFRKRVQSKGLQPRYSEDNIIASSETMAKTLKVMRKLARTDRTVIILGESGTGKELFAHAIHELSDRRHGPFLPVNFAGLPETLAESELFGYAEGAFTGARRGGKPGLFELAHNGTLFLDEIGDASPSIQALLLRVLQERHVMRVGGDQVIPVDVRIVAATNRDLRELVQAGKFRHDLYYRLFVLPLYIPSLRERREDIPLLVEHFVRRYSAGKLRVLPNVMDRLVAYEWPGNVRELEAAAQYMTSVAEGQVVTSDDLPRQLFEVAESTEDVVCHDEIFQRSDLTILYAILDSLDWAKQHGFNRLGRSAIVEYACRKNIRVSEQQVRNRMVMLREIGLIETGNRRQGSWLTAKGEIALSRIRERLRIIRETSL